MIDRTPLSLHSLTPRCLLSTQRPQTVPKLWPTAIRSKPRFLPVLVLYNLNLILISLFLFYEGSVKTTSRMNLEIFQTMNKVCNLFIRMSLCYSRFDVKGGSRLDVVIYLPLSVRRSCSSILLSRLCRWRLVRSDPLRRIQSGRRIQWLAEHQHLV